MGDVLTAAQMRALVERTRNERVNGAAYPKLFRERMMAYTRKRLADGVKVSSVARETSMDYWTLLTWLRSAKASRVAREAIDSTSKTPVIVPVRVIQRRDIDEATTVTVHGPRGTRIEQIGLDVVAELFRKLS